MKEFILTEETSERAVLVGLITPTQSEAKANEYLDELAFLAETAGAEPVKKFLQRLDQPSPVTFVGSGKITEIKNYIDENEIGLVIFDDELSAKQLKNIEQALQVKILDRTNLILDIFAKRAQTAHAKSQVELAQYQYLLPRLTRLWTHLERQRGGIGMRVPADAEGFKREHPRVDLIVQNDLPKMAQKHDVVVKILLDQADGGDQPRLLELIPAVKVVELTADPIDRPAEAGEFIFIRPAGARLFGDLDM